MRISGLGGILIVLFTCYVSTAAAAPQNSDNPSAETSGDSQVMQSFASQDDAETGVIKIGDKRKRQVMFVMGVPLLLFIMITVALGIAMGVFGKDVYVPHMIFAGLSLTLALGHAIVGLVWFWPF
ncbi:MAG: hypothetical protein PVJ39_06275 [Gammaproteobacteria bacterium]|jgi:hypothetical protein